MLDGHVMHAPHFLLETICVHVEIDLSIYTTFESLVTIFVGIDLESARNSQ